MFTTLPQNDLLDLPPSAGQRKSSWNFNLVNGVTGERLGTITPLRSTTLRHNTSQTIKRTLNISLGKVDTDTIDAVSARVELEMVLQDGSVLLAGAFDNLSLPDYQPSFGGTHACTGVLPDRRCGP